jgi:hypothetical protein
MIVRRTIARFLTVSFEFILITPRALGMIFLKNKLFTPLDKIEERARQFLLPASFVQEGFFECHTRVIDSCPYDSPKAKVMSAFPKTSTFCRAEAIWS